VRLPRADDLARDRAPVRAVDAPRERPYGRVAAAALVAAIAIVVPPTLVANALRALATETFTRWELGRLEPDRYGLTDDQREALALTGLRSIQPGSEGIVLLARATLPDGSPAFDARELSHMEDVRSVFGVLLRGELAVLVVLALLALGLARTRLRAVVPAGLLAGALTTLAIAVLAVPLILIGFDAFFTGFHEVFFEGDTWRFSNTDTLIRLYPERLWEDVSKIAAAMTVLQAVVLASVAWWWLRTVRRQR
jgi:integral membrane protein (TIGR01906 family)